MRRVYHRSGCEVEVIGKTDAFGTRPVCCGTFEVSTRILRQMREKMGVDEPIFRSIRQLEDLESMRPFEFAEAA